MLYRVHLHHERDSNNVVLTLWGTVKIYEMFENDRLEKTEGTIKNGQSKNTGNIGYTRHRTKTNKAKYTTQKTTKMRNTGPHQTT